MASTSRSSSESTLNIKRGRKKKINLNDRNAKLNVLEDLVNMEVDNVEDTNIDLPSNVETDNLSKETNTNNEKIAQTDTSNATDMLAEETQEQADNDRSMSTEEMLDVSESVTQSLGSTDFPIDVELAADFEEIGGDSLCDMSMNSTVFDVNTDYWSMNMSATSNDYDRAENKPPTVDDTVVNKGGGILAESLLQSEHHEPALVASVNETERDDVTEVEAGEISTLHRENDAAESNVDQTSNTEVKIVRRKPGRPKKKATAETERDVEQTSNTEGKTVKRKAGRPRLDDPSQAEARKLTAEELRAEIIKLLPEQGESNFSKEAGKKIKEFLRKSKILQCPREGCEKMYKNYNGYQYHVVRCGVSVHLECPDCGQNYTSREGLAYHVRTVHRKPVVPVVKPTPAPNISTTSKYSQRSRFQPDRYCDKPDTEESDSDGDKACIKNKTWRKYIEKMEGETAEPDELEESTTTTELTNMSEISAALKEKLKLKCPKKCGRNFRLAIRFYEHVKQCTGLSRAKYRCTFCAKELRTLPGIKGHILADHRTKVHNSDEESEYSGSEKTSRRAKRRQIRSFQPTSVDFRQKTKAWYEALRGESVLTCWRPSLKHWKRLHASEAEHYLPVKKTSPVFRIAPVLEGKDSTPDQDTEFELPLFSSVPINTVGGLCSITFNVGGSVWAMDWAPVPVDEKNCDQYLAIGCHRDPDKNHLLSECYKEKGVLQIWRLPKLGNDKCPAEQPEFCLGIVHDYGPLWDIRWCPSGAWESSTQVGELRRLGLLALACADGKVRIFSVPFPCSLLENAGGEVATSPEDLLFRATPHAVLSPGSLCRKYQEECGAAWALSWQPISGHKKVIASYADGTVAIWNLTTDNRILKAPTPDGLTECIFPISHFQAHNSVIRSLAWCPSEPNYIATGGYDKIMKIWDLRHTSQPVMCYNRAWSYSITWPLHWAFLIYSIDVDLLRIKGTRLFDYYASSRDDDTSHASIGYLPHNATAWDNDYSNWINVVASVDAAGGLAMNFLNEGFYQRKPRVKKPIFRAYVEPIVGCEDQSVSDREIPSGSSTNSSEKQESFKIIFRDTHPLKATKAERDFLSNDSAYVSPDQPTHAALQKVRWNPNFSSYFWLATAGKCGLVRLCYVDHLL